MVKFFCIFYCVVPSDIEISKICMSTKGWKESQRKHFKKQAIYMYSRNASKPFIIFISPSFFSLILVGTELCLFVTCVSDMFTPYNLQCKFYTVQSEYDCAIYKALLNKVNPRRKYWSLVHIWKHIIFPKSYYLCNTLLLYQLRDIDVSSK